MYSTEFNHAENRRVIAGTEMVVNCEHFNTRLQSVVESTEGVDGRAIFKEAAERATSTCLQRLFGEHTPVEEKLSLVSQYYTDVGLGVLHLDKIASNVIEQSSSNFVLGWATNFAGVERKACTYTEGFLQGLFHAVYGESVTAEETSCMHSGADKCSFKITRGRAEAVKPVRIVDQETFRSTRKASPEGHAHLSSETVNAEMITGGILAHMPLVGNEAGLCPVFMQDDGSPGAHLSSVPMEFYSLLFTDYSTQMAKLGRAEEARVRLIGGAEACSYHTWGKVMTSHEWHGMLDPMVKNTEDKMYGLIAMANMLGRGKWQVVDFKPGERLELESFNNYEGESYERLGYKPSACSCSTMNGTATAHMNLVYPAHELNADDCIGDFKTTETKCVARGDDRCSFVTERRKLTELEIEAQKAPAGASCAL